MDNVIESTTSLIKNVLHAVENTLVNTWTNHEKERHLLLIPLQKYRIHLLGWSPIFCKLHTSRKM